MLKYLLFFIGIICFIACDSSETSLGQEYKIFEHDVSTTRNLYYKSQGIGPSPICSVGFNEQYIWVKLCKQKEGVSYYLVDRKLYAQSPLQRESPGYWEFGNLSNLQSKLLENGISVNWKQEYHNPYE